MNRYRYSLDIYGPEVVASAVSTAISTIAIMASTSASDERERLREWLEHRVDPAFARYGEEDKFSKGLYEAFITMLDQSLADRPSTKHGADGEPKRPELVRPESGSGGSFKGRVHR